MTVAKAHNHLTATLNHIGGIKKCNQKWNDILIWLSYYAGYCCFSWTCHFLFYLKIMLCTSQLQTQKFVCFFFWKMEWWRWSTACVFINMLLFASPLSDKPPEFLPRFPPPQVQCSPASGWLLLCWLLVLVQPQGRAVELDLHETVLFAGWSAPWLKPGQLLIIGGKYMKESSIYG